MDELDDKARATEGLGVGAGVNEPLQWEAHWTLEKRHGDVNTYEGGPEAFKRDIKPYEVIEFGGNLLMNLGGGVIWDLVCDMGDGSQAFDAANAYLGVGDGGGVPAAVAQTDLQGGVHHERAGMNGGYPQYTDRVVTFQADFGSGAGEYVWSEVGTFNTATFGTGVMLNRKCQALGTKGAGSTWTLSETITLS